MRLQSFNRNVPMFCHQDDCSCCYIRSMKGNRKPNRLRTGFLRFNALVYLQVDILNPFDVVGILWRVIRLRNSVTR